MAPVFDTDVDQDQLEIEFWEKVKTRVAYRKRLWIILTGVLFVILSTVPVWMDRAPKWRGQDVLRKVAESLQTELTASAVDKGIRRFRWEPEGVLSVARVSRCDDANVLVESRIAFELEGLQVLDQQTAEGLGIPGVMDEFCYDPVRGPNYQRDRPWAFGVIPVKDVAEARLDRISLLFLQGDTVQIEFDQLTN